MTRRNATTHSATHDGAHGSTAPRQPGIGRACGPTSSPPPHPTPPHRRRAADLPACSPAIVLFDFAAAFPSVDRRYMRHCLRAMHLPPGMRAAVDALYTPSRNFFGRPTGPDAPSYESATGTPPGCPLSGSVFSICTTPLLRMLSHIVGEDVVFAFADDIAICIRSVTQLAAVHRAFAAFFTATSLRLKPAKCILLPLRMQGWSNDEQVAAYTDLLRRTVPEWHDFQICGEAKYLGFVVGPRATLQSQWQAPVEKYETRIRSVTATTTAPSLSFRFHSISSVPVLNYTAQLRPPSASARHAVLVAYQRMLRFPLKALPQDLVGQLHSMGIHRDEDPMTTCAATMMRTAVSMRQEVADAAERLRRVRDEHSALRAMGDPAHHADRLMWAAPATCDVLEAALDAWDASDAAREVGREGDGAKCTQRACYSVAWRAQNAMSPHVALLPRLRRWFRADRAPRPLLESWADEAIRSVAQAAPSFGLVMLRTWCDAWATSARRGHQVEHCIMCGRARADRLTHLVRCAPLWRATARATQVAPPNCLRQVLCLVASPSMPGPAPRLRTRPPASVFALSVASDVYHKLRARRPFGGHRSAPMSGREIASAATHAARRLGRL